MAEVKGTSWSDMEKMVNKYVRRVCTVGAGKIRDELYNEARASIVAFYNHYEPLYYNRHYWNFSAKEDHGKGNSFRKFYDDRHKVVWGGIELTPQLLEDVYQKSSNNSITTQEVFDTVYAGFHGPAGMFYTPKTFSVIPPRMIPSPKQRLLNKQKDILKNQNKYIDYGKRIAKRENPLFAK